MYNQKMLALGQVRSVIRETFEYGNRRKAEIGKENVFDFSLGNPSTPPPPCVNDTLIQLLQTASPTDLHGYTSAPGDMLVRQAVAGYIASTYHANITADGIYMTCGAAASLTISIHALACEEDEFIVFAPYFPEYRVFVEKAGAKLVVVEPDYATFGIHYEDLASKITPHTKGVILNTPNNPTGRVLKKAELERLADMLKAASGAYGHPIYLLSDEPYRHLVYDETAPLPYLTNLYPATLVCDSFSKCLSLPGERIGYVAISHDMPNYAEVFAALCGAGRALGFVCAPSLMQKMLPACLGETADLSAYRLNRDLLYQHLTVYGFECIYPDGAFYLFLKSPIPDANAFCLKARDFELLLVASDSFGCPGYVRIAYCVATDMIERSLPAFKALADFYHLG